MILGLNMNSQMNDAHANVMILGITGCRMTIGFAETERGKKNEHRFVICNHRSVRHYHRSTDNNCAVYMKERE